MYRKMAQIKLKSQKLKYCMNIEQSKKLPTDQFEKKPILSVSKNISIVTLSRIKFKKKI